MKSTLTSLCFVSLLLLGTSLFAMPQIAYAAPDDNQSDASDPKEDMDAGDQDDGDKDDTAPAVPEKHQHASAPQKESAAGEAVPPTASTANGSWWHPHPGTKWQIQYVGGIDTSTKIDMFDLDLFDTDVSTIQALRANGTKVVCYFSAGSYEAWRPDVKRFPSYVLGRKMEGWKGEKWLDIRKLKVLRPIMEDRIKLAKQKGCDGIDPDNVEGYDNKSGFDLAASDQIAYNKMIAEIGHSMGLAVGLKNDLEQIADLMPYFDFQVNEQCFEYQGCNDLVPFIKANKPVFNIEYNVSTESYCSRANALNFDSVKKDLDLDAKVKRCR